MKYILIVWLGYSVATAELDTEYACNQAGKNFIESIKFRNKNAGYSCSATRVFPLSKPVENPERYR